MSTIEPNNKNTSPSEELPDRVIAALKAKKVTAACPSCGENSWGLTSNEVRIEAYPLATPLGTTTRYIPSAALVCNNCGFIRLHSLVALKIDPDQASSKGNVEAKA